MYYYTSFFDYCKSVVGLKHPQHSYRELQKFRSISEDQLNTKDFQTRLELEVNYEEVKMGFANSGNFFPNDDENSRR